MFAILLALAIAGPSQAAPATVAGAWTGALMVREGGETHEDPIRLVLKQNGDVLTGTAGPDADRQYPIKNGKFVATKDAVAVAFDVIVNGTNVSFNLKLGDGVLKGELLVEGEDGRRLTGTVELRRITTTS